jgi:hypothetical protein
MDAERLEVPVRLALIGFDALCVGRGRPPAIEDGVEGRFGLPVGVDLGGVAQNRHLAITTGLFKRGSAQRCGSVDWRLPQGEADRSAGDGRLDVDRLARGKTSIQLLLPDVVGCST